MKDKEKKVPKNGNSNYIVSSDAESVLYGILLVLLGFIGLVNQGPIGHFITYCIVYCFGVFYAFFFLLVIFFGVYLIFKKRFYRIQIDLKVLGVSLILFAFSLGASTNDSLIVENSLSTFNQQMEYVQDSRFYISDLSQVPLIGGGIIGFFFVGLLNTTLSPLGTKMIIILFLLVGSLLLFKNFVVRFFKTTVKFIKNRREIRKQAIEEEKQLEAQRKEKKLVDESDLNLISSNTTKELDKGFYFEREEKASPSSFFEEELSSPIKKEEIKTEPKKNVSSYFIEQPKKDSTPIKESQIETEPFFEKPMTEVKHSVVINEDETKEELVLNKFSSHEKELEENNENDIKNTVVEDDKPYIYPSVSLLSDVYDSSKDALNIQVADEYARKINELFQEYKIGASVISYTIGPSVTRFDVKTNPGVKLASLQGIQTELAVKLGGNKTVRIVLIVEGKDTSAIEVGNKYVSTVSFKECFSSLLAYPKQKLIFPLGKNISGEVVKTSIDELPHLLVAGTTGSGKSMFIHSLIMSLIMRNEPSELKLLLIDPKKVEFLKYHDLPHLLCPVITETNEAISALKKLVDEMQRRYYIFSTAGNGASKYDEYMEIAREKNLEKLPVIVMIVDEFADFIQDNPKEIETPIQRIGQKARACGIYMILATQRPSVGFISGDIKANIPSRIALSVATSMDSRVIIDEVGAETLLGKGDLLARVPESKSLIRVQSSFISTKDIVSVCDYLRKNYKPHYDPNFLDLEEKIPTFEGSAISSGRRTELDALHEEVKQYVLETKIASTSKIQNAFAMGFSRADYILDCLEREGIVKRLSSGRRIVVSQMDNKDE